MSAELMREVLDAVEASDGNIGAAARYLGITRDKAKHWFNKAKQATQRDQSAEIHVPNGPPANESIADLIARKKARFERDEATEEFQKLIPIRINIDGPVAICAVGDPHVDDDKCDIGQIETDMTVIGKTEGMYALHVGDITNNWVGRLGRLYAHQSTTASDGIRLAEWMFGLAKPIAVIGGNHDLWNEGMSWLNFCVKQAGCNLLQPHSARMNLMFPNGNSVRVHTRHDFPGYSQFNPVHGLRREHLFGLRDHINIAGHKHVDTYAVVPSPDGYMQHMLRVSGYKAADDYAKAGNLPVMKMAPTCALIINPDTKSPAELVKPFWDMAEAADFLKFKRRRK